MKMDDMSLRALFFAVQVLRESIPCALAQACRKGHIMDCSIKQCR